MMRHLFRNFTAVAGVPLLQEPIWMTVAGLMLHGLVTVILAAVDVCLCHVLHHC
jgi:hypothetical protein